MARRAPIYAVLQRFIDADPAQAALALEELPEGEAAELLRQISPSRAAQCLERLRPDFAASVLESLGPGQAGMLLEKVSPKDAADLFRALSPEGRQAVLDALSEERKKALQELLAYPEHSAGRLMTTEFIAFPKEARVRDVVSRLRALAQKGSKAVYSYVVDPDHKLIGVLNMRDVVLADAGATVESIMRPEVAAVSAFTDREEVVRIAAEKHYLSMPVVDSQGRLIGAVSTSEILESSQEEASEDLQLLFGGSADERPLSPLGFKVRRRLPWLHINLLTAFLAGSVVALFEDLIARLSVLAVFLPIVAGQGGNSGTQSLAVALRGLVMREIEPSDARQVVLREGATGLINGAVIGAVTAAAAWLWKGDPVLGLVIGLAMVVNLAAAGLAGAAIPLAMKRLGFDPAQSSGIFLTTVTDVVGFLSFLGFALLFESRLAG